MSMEQCFPLSLRIGFLSSLRVSWAHFRVQLQSQVAAVAMRNSGIGATEHVQPAARGNTFGCGSHYLLRQCYTLRCISGRKVFGRSTKRMSFIGGKPIRGSNTHSGELHWECFCEQSSLEPQVVNPAHKYSVTSYPLAYSLVILPLTVAWWLLFSLISHYYVPPAATFFAETMFYLSKAVNVLLFLIIRTGLLLFPRPKEFPSSK